MEHRLALDPLTRGDSPYRFEKMPARQIEAFLFIRE
jgi:hypothetical protein